MPSATIKLFLVQGDAKRLRTAELSNWTGKAIAGPRSEFEDVLSREEAANSGVYFITGSEPEIGKTAVYVGEAESIRDRLRNHLDKDFWNHVIFFISKDENLTKAHIRYLEGRLIEQAKKTGRSVVMNGQSSGAKLPSPTVKTWKSSWAAFINSCLCLEPTFFFQPDRQFLEKPKSSCFSAKLKGLRP